LFQIQYVPSPRRLVAISRVLGMAVLGLILQRFLPQRIAAEGERALKRISPIALQFFRNIQLFSEQFQEASGLEPIHASGIWMYGKDGGKGIEPIGREETGADWPSASSDGKYIYR
jgi:uncharacterized membrane protein